MKLAITLIIIFFILGIIILFAVPFLFQNVSLPGFSSGGSGIAGMFKSVDGGEFWFSKNSIESSKSNISSANITDFVFDPYDSNIIYIGTSGFGILKSVNNGESWKRLIDDNGNLSNIATINNIVIDSKDSSHIFVSAFQGRSGAIFKSEDAGRSWKQLYIVPITKQDIKSLAIDPKDPRILYAGTTAGGFLTSSDRGESWRSLKWFLDSVEKISIDPFSPENIFVAVDGEGLFRSGDRGSSWTDLNDSLSGYDSATKIESIVFDLRRPNILYITSAYGLLRSSDKGSSWHALKILVSPEALPVLDLAIDKNDSKRMFMTAGSKVYMTEDEGENWTVKGLSTGKNAKLIRIDPKNSKVIFVGIHK